MHDPQKPRESNPSVRWMMSKRRTLFAVTMALITIFAGTQPCEAAPIDDYNLALQLYKQERWDAAASQLESFLSAAPNHEKAPLAKLYLGQAYVHLREFAKARPVFRDFVRSYPEHPEVLLAMYRVGESSYFLNDYPTARKELRDFLNKAPADQELAPWALQYLGEIELQLGNMQAAADAFEKLLPQVKNERLLDEVRFGLARAYDGLDRSAEAIELYQQLAKNPQAPRAGDARFNIAARMFEDKQFAKAAEGFQGVVEQFPQHNLATLATLNTGFSQYHLEDYPAAIASFRKLEGDEKYGKTARYWIALSFKSQDEYAQASEMLLSLYEEDKQQPLAENLLFHAADSQLRAEQYADAVRIFVDVTDRFPTGGLGDDALYSAIEAAVLADDFDQAEKLHQRFSQQYPDSGLGLPVEVLHGRLLLARGDRLAAEENEADKQQGQQAYRQSAETFLHVLESSNLPKTQTLARLQLARSWDRLGNYQRLIETLDPLAEDALADDATDDQLRALFMQSNGWLALKNNDKALQAAEQYLERRPQGDNAGDAWANVALAHAHLGNWKASAAAVENLRGFNDQSLSSRITYEVAEAAYDAQQWQRSQGHYETIIDEGPAGEFYTPSVSGLAYSLHEAAREALKASEAASSEQQPTAGTAGLAQAVSQFNQAAQWFGQLAEIAGRNDDLSVQSNAAYMRGLSLKLARRRQEAAEELVKVAKQFSLSGKPENPSPEQLDAAFNAFRAWKEAARTFAELKQIEQADEAYAGAYGQLKRQPAEKRDELDLMINEWALLHYNAHDYERSDELFRRLIEETPDSEWADDAKLLIAESDFFADRFSQARDAFRKIAEDPATDSFVRKRALLLLIDAAYAVDDWESVANASQSLRTLLEEQAPDSVDRWYAEFRLAEAALRQGETESAAETLKQLIDQHAQSEIGQAEWFPNVWLMLAEAQLRSKDYAAVEKTVAAFKEQHPESTLTYQFDDVLGRRFKNEGRFDEAREAFQRVIDSPQGRGTETAAKAQFFIAETKLTQANSLKTNQPEKANDAYGEAFLAYFRVLQYDFPQWQAPALLMAGKCDEALMRWSGAKKNYQQLMTDYPESEYVAEARELLDELNRRFPTTSSP